MKFLLLQEMKTTQNAPVRAKQAFNTDENGLGLLLDSLGTSAAAVVVLPDTAYLQRKDFDQLVEYVDEAADYGSRYVH